MARGEKDIVQVSVKAEESDIITESTSQKYFADFHALLTKPSCREVAVQGPRRDNKAEAIKDCEILRKTFENEGELGVKRIAESLRTKASDAPVSTPEALESIYNAMRPVAAPERLIPPGEGWVRFNDEMLWEPRSEVYFAQKGAQMGKYLMKDAKTNQFSTVDSPHQSVDAPVAVRAAGTNILRSGSKLDRTVLLPELKKIARLALKFPLSFLDSPASAYALFQGVRSAEAADWCAKNFHLKLLPLLAKKIHAWKSEELQRLMESVLSDLDSEVLKSAAAFSGSSAVLALLLGDRLFISAVGQFRVVLLYDDQSSRELMKGVDLAQDAERIEEAKGHLRKDMLIRVPDSESNDAERVLMARNPFQVLQMEPNGLDEKQVRTQYRKVALKVHPDKQTEDAQSFKKAFARLDGAKEVLESLCSADKASVLELHQTLQAEVHTREGAAALLGVDSTPTTETEHLVEEAAKASRMGIKKLEKLEHLVRAEYDLAVATYKEAVETLRRPSSKEALARQEALRLQPLPMGRALGCRDMRFPAALVVMRPESVSWQVQRGVRVALLCGATASLTDQQLLKSSTSFKRCPKASALRWCQELQSNSVVAACLRCEAKGEEGQGAKSSGGPLAKKQKTTQGGGRSIFLRHILFKHQQLRVLDPAARREGAARGAHEAETTALQVLQRLLVEPNAFVKLCREHSDCASAEQPGTLAGHMGWVARNEQEPPMEEAAFALGLNEFGDLVVTSRGVHVIQRIG
ncbi:unnamed protein product [Durusdinium trenchii]|uniref:peptidylprolyl isomerase n=1 Tax=Durusdinium trenchii TaxID=1381693 RepID=A0ABP0HNK3_9DINO